MAENFVDPSIAGELICGVGGVLAAHLFDKNDPAACTKPAVLLEGEEDPAEGVLTRWVKVVRIECEPRDRVKGQGHTDVADVVAVFNIVCRDAAMSKSSRAVNQTGQVIARLLNHAHATHAATGHDLQLDRAVVRPDPPGTLLERERTGVLTVTGTLQRYKADGTGDVMDATVGIDG